MRTSDIFWLCFGASMAWPLLILCRQVVAGLRWIRNNICERIFYR